ncbi:hypothetical protein SFC65_19950 [Priestia filamentosa]|uniref:hypothetical protein n=1 Tax=Priestia filamentosa TaxID=1402861 RepID=UPI00398209A4
MDYKFSATFNGLRFEEHFSGIETLEEARNSFIYLITQHFLLNRDCGLLYTLKNRLAITGETVKEFFGRNARYVQHYNEWLNGGNLVVTEVSVITMFSHIIEKLVPINCEEIQIYKGAYRAIDVLEKVKETRTTHPEGDLVRFKKWSKKWKIVRDRVSSK